MGRGASQLSKAAGEAQSQSARRSTPAGTPSEINAHATNAMSAANSLDHSCPHAGMPRPFLDYPRATERFPKERLPVPWINWSEVIRYRDWENDYDDNALDRLHESGYTLCGNCGEPLGKNKVFARLRDPMETSGPGLHPICAIQSYHYCPHSVGMDPDTAFRLYTGPGCGMDLEQAERKHATRYYDMSAVRVLDEAVPVKMAEMNLPGLKAGVSGTRVVLS